MLSVPAIPQPACKRAELLSQASDVFRQRVQEAVEKRRTAERELAEIEKQIKQVEERRCKREHELLRDYDQEIQKWEEATKELTEMINQQLAEIEGQQQPLSPNQQKEWARQRNMLGRNVQTLQNKLSAQRAQLEPLIHKHTVTLHELENDLTQWEQIEKKTMRHSLASRYLGTGRPLKTASSSM